MKTYLHYPMKSLVNCRDLGGMPTADGGVTRFGTLIRSELPAGLTEEDLAMLRALNVTTSIDLRYDEEIEQSPSDLQRCDWVDYHIVSVFSRQAALGGKKAAPPDPSGLFTLEWRPVYRVMLSSRPEWVREICDITAAAPGAVHYHCTTGKDRTGLFSMLMLSICGVGEDDIAANYSLSEIYMRPYYIDMLRRQNYSDYSGEDLSRGFFSTSHNIMRDIMDGLKEEYGSVVSYIRACGVSDETMDAIRAKLVEY